MTNETTIKVPKKYQHMVKSICRIDGSLGKYALTFLPEFSDGGAVYCCDSQADILEMIRLTYAAIQEAASVLAPEEIKESETEMLELPETLGDCLELLENDRIAAGFCIYSDLVDAVAMEFDENATNDQIIAALGVRFSAWGLEAMDGEDWDMLYRNVACKRDSMQLTDDILEMIRLTYTTIYESAATSETVGKDEPANVEETASGQDALSRTDTTTSLEIKSHVDDLEVLENDGSAVSNKQGSVPLTVAADASETPTNQEAKAPVVNDQRVEYVVTECLHPNGYPVVGVYCLSRVCSHHRFSNNSRFPTRRAALVYARLRLEALPDSAVFRDYTGLGALPP